jgi:hypothetical protein
MTLGAANSGSTESASTVATAPNIQKGPAVMISQAPISGATMPITVETASRAPTWCPRCSASPIDAK